MIDRSSGPQLPPKLQILFARTSDLDEPLRGVLQANLTAARQDASAEQVLADSLGQLGYLPEETKQLASKLLTPTRSKP